VHPDLAAEQPGDLPADGEAQPRAAVLPARPGVGLLERLEDHLQLVVGDADARVGDRERQHPAGAAEHRVVGGPAAGGGLDPHQHLALFGELERVRQQVPQDLLEPLRVGRDGPGQTGRQLDLHRDPLGLGHRPERPLDVAPQVVERHVAHVDRHRPRLDLGHVEDVVDQRQQVGARGVDRLGELHLLAGEVLLGVLREHLGQDQQAVERRPQLVRHVGQELALVLRGQRELLGLLLQLLLGQLDLAVLPLHVRLLGAELPGLGLQLLVGPLQLVLPTPEG